MKNDFVKSIQLIVLWLILITLLIILCSVLKQNNNERYTIIHGSGTPTILLDKETGITWRNVWCDDEEKLLHCWSLMRYGGSVVPKGEQDARNFRTKNIYK